MFFEQMQLDEMALSESANYTLSVAIHPGIHGRTYKLAELSGSIGAALCPPELQPTVPESGVQNRARYAACQASGVRS